MNTLSQIVNGVSNTFNSIKQALTPHGTTTNNSTGTNLLNYKPERLVISPTAKLTPQVMSKPLNLGDIIGSLKPLAVNLFKSQDVVKSYDRYKSSKGITDFLYNTPLINPPVTQELLSKSKFQSPTVGGYGKGQIVDPIVNGLKDITSNKTNLLEKAIGATGVLGGAFSATPPGLAFNLGAGGISAGIKGIRTNDINSIFTKNLKQDIENPTSIAGEGFGVKNPFIALAVDLILTHNPKSSFNKLKSVSGLSKNVKEVVENPETRSTLERVILSKNELVKRGMSEAEADKTTIVHASELLGWNKKETKNVLDSLTADYKEIETDFKTIFAKWIGNRDVANTTGFEAGTKIKVPTAKAWEVINSIEGKTNKDPQVMAIANKFKGEFETAYSEAKKLNIDLGYIRNYITHVYANSADEVKQILSARGSMGKGRQIKTYEEALGLGLKPLYTAPQQILAHYISNIEKLKANFEFISDLKTKGLLNEGYRKGYIALTGEGFPRLNSTNKWGQKVESYYFAHPEIAKVINNLFTEETQGIVQKVTGLTAGLSSKLQDWHLAGGAPNSSINAFSMAQLLKENLAGRLVSPVTDFARSNNNVKTTEFLTENIPYIKMMQKNNVPVNGLSIERLVDKGFIKNIIGDEGGLGKVEHVWNQIFNNKTFNNFLPSLQVSFFKDVYNQALRAGKSELEAEKIASKATFNFYGLTNTSKQALQNKTVQNVISTTLFAPKYRQALINVWLNSVKGLKDPLAIENQSTTKFLVGSAITYAIYDQINKQFTSKHIFNNPTGHEFEILIPLSKLSGNNSDDTVLRVPFLPSLFTIPRLMGQGASNLYHGDFVGAGQQLRGVTSTLLQPAIGMALNQDYYGRAIYGEEGIGAGNYLFNQLSHPYLGALANQGLIPGVKPTKEIPLYQTIVTALELPIRFTTENSINGQSYYAIRDEEIKNLNSEEQKAFERLQQKNTGIKDTIGEAKLRLNYPKVLKVETDIAKKVSEDTGKPLSPFYSLPLQYKKLVLTTSTLAPGSTEKSQLINSNIDFFKSYWKANEDYYNDTKATAKATETEVTSAIKQKLDFYYNLPKGTGLRSEYIKNNPDLVEYWNKKTEETNKQRATLGLTPLPPFTPYSNTKLNNKYASLRKKTFKGKKIKIKAIKFKVPKVAKLKPIQPPKLKLTIPKVRSAYA